MTVSLKRPQPASPLASSTSCGRAAQCAHPSCIAFLVQKTPTMMRLDRCGCQLPIQHIISDTHHRRSQNTMRLSCCLTQHTGGHKPGLAWVRAERLLVSAGAGNSCTVAGPALLRRGHHCTQHGIATCMTQSRNIRSGRLPAPVSEAMLAQEEPSDPCANSWRRRQPQNATALPTFTTTCTIDKRIKLDARHYSYRCKRARAAYQPSRWRGGGAGASRKERGP